VRISGSADIPFDQSVFGFASLHAVVGSGAVSLNATRGGSQLSSQGSAGSTLTLGFMGYKALRIVPQSISGATAVLQISPV
jgi:hypothetical protein